MEKIEIPTGDPTPKMIRAARAAAGLTQREATRAVFGPDSPRTFQNWENGSRKMSLGSYVLFLLMTGQISDAQARAAGP